MDVHKDSITIAILPAGAKTPTRLDRLPNDAAKLKKWIGRAARDGEIRSCYEASGAGYVLHRALQEWGYACDVIAPSLIPKRPGVQRKHDKRDATDLARLYRAGELVVVRIPPEAEERVRDVVRCRETFQREVLKSRHYILKFLARRGFVFREGTNWCTPHLKWLQHLTTDGSALAPHDRLVFREYHALLLYKLQRRDALDRQIEELRVAADARAHGQPAAMLPRDLGAFRDGAGHGDRRLAPLRTPRAARVLSGTRLARRLERRSHAPGLNHESREHALPACAGPSRVELSASAADER
jgi:transposase